MALNKEKIIIARQLIGEDLCSIRKLKKLTIRDMAKITGTGMKTIGAIERGDKSYTIDAFLAYVAAINSKLSIE